MPYYVQRNFAGKIITLYASPAVQDDGFCLTDPDPLPEDHPEMIQFFAENPPPPGREITRAEVDRSRNEYEENKGRH